VFLVGLLLHHGIVQVLDRPQRIDQPRHHRGRRGPLPAFAALTQLPAKVVVSNLERGGCGKVRQLLAELYRKARKPRGVGLLKETGEPCRRDRDSRRRLQLLPDAPHAALHACDGGGSDRKAVGHGPAVRRGC
jgi:hypothetical protein